jgi:uncharacterized Zn finger protein
MSSQRPPHRPIGANAKYGLASTMLRVTAAELGDSGRTMRARRLQDDRAVLTLHVEHGTIVGSVQGGSSLPYSVRWRCRPLSAHVETARRALAVDDPARATRLVPAARDLTAVCDCPDDSPACKHALAVLLELADDASHDGSVLARLRGVPFDATDAVDPTDPALDHTTPPPDRSPRVDSPSTSRTSTSQTPTSQTPTAQTPASPTSTQLPLSRADAGQPRHLRLVRDGVVPTPFVDPLAEVLGFPEGARLLAGRHRIEPLASPTPRGPDDLMRDVLADALEWMQGASPW